MTFAATALSLYVRTKAQFHHLTNPAPPPADRNHPPCRIELAFPLHRARTPKRRRRPRLLAGAVRYLLRSFPAPTPLPAPPPVRKPPCRLCAAVIT
ncbi:hypothetical protein JOD27_008618 [Lentzea nigeriaca]|nr:hypothetical protein [Lentzea nigeriaca]